MIYVDVKGNLGNQMFEYAFARKIQEKTGQKICMNTYFLNKYKPEYSCTLNDFILNKNNVIFDDKVPLPWFVNTYSGIVRVLKGLFPMQFYNIMKNFGVFIWMKNTYVTFPLEKKHINYYIAGYWQSLEYFSDIDSIIRDEFLPKYPVRSENIDLLRKIESTESICVTIRRGDYVTNEKYRREFFLCDTEFFLEGVKQIKEEIPDSVIFIFSDDIQWVRENVAFEGEIYYESGTDPVWEKMRLMSSCKHFVISNSSFSWWAQHLSKSINKIVYAPSKWYPDGRVCDIYEKNWRYIKV
jgi:hypothetical protein